MAEVKVYAFGQSSLCGVTSKATKGGTRNLRSLCLTGPPAAASWAMGRASYGCLEKWHCVLPLVMLVLESHGLCVSDSARAAT